VKLCISITVTCVKHFFNVLMVMKMVMVQKFHVISSKFNIAVICTSENYTVYAEMNQ
jgi:hypothetical protein